MDMKQTFFCIMACLLCFHSQAALNIHHNNQQSTDQKLLKPIVTNQYIYDDTYPSFKKWTDEKEITAQLNQVFCQNLQKQGIVFVGNYPIKIADIASGPADTIIKYFQNIPFTPGFDIRATDYNETYAGTAFHRGQAYKNLWAAKKSQEIPLVNFSVKRGDAFRGHLNDLLAQQGETIKTNTFQVVNLSHGIYHAESDKHGTAVEKTDRILNDIARHLLDVRGICIMYHVSFFHQDIQYFRYKYGRKSHMQSKSDTGAVEIADHTLSILKSCKKQKIPYYAMDFQTKLFFSKNIKSYAQLFKNPSQFEKLRSKPDAWEDYQKLSFIVQRASNEMAFDKTDSGLSAYINEVLSALKGDNRGRWYLVLNEKMQIILNPEASVAFKHHVQQALNHTKQQLPTIQQQGSQKFEQRHPALVIPPPVRG